MKRIGLTARVDDVPERTERRDAVDQALARILADLGFAPVILSNVVSEPNHYLAALALDGILLSGGNDLSTLADGCNMALERDRLECAAIEHCVKYGRPIFGVCRGLQVLNSHFGGEVVKVDGHVGTRHVVNATSKWPVARATEITVNSFHGFGVMPDGIAPGFEAWAISETDGTIEAIGHRSYPFAAVMWHPERNSPVENLDTTLMGKVLGNVK